MTYPIGSYEWTCNEDPVLVEKWRTVSWFFCEVSPLTREDIEHAFAYYTREIESKGNCHRPPPRATVHRERRPGPSGRMRSRYVATVLLNGSGIRSVVGDFPRHSEARAAGAVAETRARVDFIRRALGVSD